ASALSFFISFFFFSSRRRHTRSLRDWSSDVCSSDLARTEWGGGERITALGQNANNSAMILGAGLIALLALQYGLERPLVRRRWRSEERRVGKEGRAGGAQEQGKKKKSDGEDEGEREE